MSKGLKTQAAEKGSRSSSEPDDHENPPKQYLASEKYLEGSCPWRPA